MRRWLGAGVGVIVALTASAAFAVSGEDRITTFAGVGLGGGGSYSDNIPATKAWMTQVGGLAVDGKGNVYISEPDFHRVRKVNTAGTITSVAGLWSRSGYSGDGGPAAKARLCSPQGLAVDASGNLYVADTCNHRVRKVSPSGTISTFAGRTSAVPSVGGFSGDGGPATAAEMKGPRGVATDGRGNVFIVDSGNYRVRMVTPAGTITTVAGAKESCGGKGLDDVGDGGPATAAYLCFPQALALDRAGNLYIVSLSANRVRKVNSGGTISTLAGGVERGFAGDGGPASRARLQRPSAVAVDPQGNVYIADSGNHRVRKVTPGGTITTIVGTGPTDLNGGFGGDGGPARAARMSLPLALALGKRGELYIGETARVRKVGGAVSRPAAPARPAASKLLAYVDRVGTVLRQSAAGRRTLASALTAGFNCSITPRAAGDRVNRVVANRQGLLRQLAGLQAPTPQAKTALGLLRLGIQHSIQADIRYRDGFYALGTRGCPLPPNRSFTLARQSDTRASAAKRQFVATYNPIAKRVGRRTWLANEI